MAHRDGDEYYMLMTLVENGEQTSRRIHRIEWQEKDGQWNSREGDKLPGDFTLKTGTGFKGKHKGEFLGVDMGPRPPKPSRSRF